MKYVVHGIQQRAPMRPNIRSFKMKRFFVACLISVVCLFASTLCEAAPYDVAFSGTGISSEEALEIQIAFWDEINKRPEFQNFLFLNTLGSRRTQRVEEALEGSPEGNLIHGVVKVTVGNVPALGGIEGKYSLDIYVFRNQKMARHVKFQESETYPFYPNKPHATIVTRAVSDVVARLKGNNEAFIQLSKSLVEETVPEFSVKDDFVDKGSAPTTDQMTLFRQLVREGKITSATFQKFLDDAQEDTVEKDAVKKEPSKTAKRLQRAVNELGIEGVVIVSAEKLWERPGNFPGMDIEIKTMGWDVEYELHGEKKELTEERVSVPTGPASEMEGRAMWNLARESEEDVR